MTYFWLRLDASKSDCFHVLYDTNASANCGHHKTRRIKSHIHADDVEVGGCGVGTFSSN